MRVNADEDVGKVDSGCVLDLLCSVEECLVVQPLCRVVLQAKSDFDSFLRAHMTDEEKVLVLDQKTPSRQTSFPCP